MRSQVQGNHYHDNHVPFDVRFYSTPSPVILLFYKPHLLVKSNKRQHNVICLFILIIYSPPPTQKWFHNWTGTGLLPSNTLTFSCTILFIFVMVCMLLQASYFLSCTFTCMYPFIVQPGKSESLADIRNNCISE